MVAVLDEVQVDPRVVAVGRAEQVVQSRRRRPLLAIPLLAVREQEREKTVCEFAHAVERSPREVASASKAKTTVLEPHDEEAKADDALGTEAETNRDVAMVAREDGHVGVMVEENGNESGGREVAARVSVLDASVEVVRGNVLDQPGEPGRAES